MLNKCYEVFPRKQEIALHFPSFYSTWASLYGRKSKMRKRGDLLNDIRKESYYIKDNVLRRLHGKPIRSLILSIDPKDNPPTELLNWINGSNPKSQKPSGSCVCSSWNLFQLGCKCGGN